MEVSQIIMKMQGIIVKDEGGFHGNNERRPLILGQVGLIHHKAPKLAILLFLRNPSNLRPTRVFWAITVWNIIYKKGIATLQLDK